MATNKMGRLKLFKCSRVLGIQRLSLARAPPASVRILVKAALEPGRTNDFLTRFRVEGFTV